MLKIGMVGAGFIGQICHLMNFSEIKRCRVVALAEYRPKLRKEVAQRFGIPRVYENHLQLLQDPEVEAVIVVTPRPYTGPVVLDCLKAGKHVLSEKPMAGSVEQGERLIEAALRTGVIYAVGYMKRFDEGTQTARRLLHEMQASGELGQLLFARAHCFMGDSYCNASGHVVTDERAQYADGGWPQAPDWLPKEWNKVFAAHINTFSHNTNLLRYLFDATPRVEFADLVKRAAQVAVLDFGAFNATLETGRASNRDWDEVTEIYFEHGRLSLKTPPALLRNVPASVELYKAGTIQQVVTPKLNWTWSFRRQAEAFVDDVLGGRESLNSGRDALQELQLFEAMWRWELGRRGD